MFHGGDVMPCYHPLIRVADRNKWEVAADGHKYHPAKILGGDDRPDDIEQLKQYSAGHYEKQLIPCGKCIGCRLDYSREWANRGYLEAKEYENNWFVTITYDDKHLPKPDEIIDNNGISWTNDGSWEGGTLVPSHLTQFIKNVRQIMKRDYNQDGIRFMACGEYGDEGARPHYHIIFYNLNLPTEDLYNPRIINKEFYYQSKIIERAWDKGISNVSEATWNTIAYTARYITKKINGEGSDELYHSHGKFKEFMRVSRMPGIGEGYYEKHKDEIYTTDSILIKNKTGSIHVKPPSYYDKKFEKENPKRWREIQKQRRKDGENQNKLKGLNTSLFIRKQLEIEERTKECNNMALIRAMEKSTR